MKRELVNLVNGLKASNPDAYMAFATFQGEDRAQKDYVSERVAPIRIGDGSDQLVQAINALTFDQTVTRRNVLSVFRETLPKLAPRSQLGGSYLYIATQADSDGNDTLVELDVVRQLVTSSVKLFVAETGGGRYSLSRVSALSDGYYLYGSTLGSTYPFPPMSQEIYRTIKSALNVDRAMVRVFQNDSLF